MTERTFSIPQVQTGTFGTVADILRVMIDNDIPLNAEIEYEGCGSHRIQFVWNEPTEIEIPCAPINELMSMREIDA